MKKQDVKRKWDLLKKEKRDSSIKEIIHHFKTEKNEGHIIFIFLAIILLALLHGGSFVLLMLFGSAMA